MIPKLKTLIFFLFLCLPAINATPAQVKDTTGPNTQPVISTVIKVPAQPEITFVRSDDDDTTGSQHGKYVVINPGHNLVFAIQNPLAFLNTKPNDNVRVVLYVNGNEMVGISSRWQSKTTRLQINSGQVVLPAVDTIRIALVRSDSTQSAWHYFYSKTVNTTDNFAVVNVSVGWENMSGLPVNADIKQVKITYYSTAEFWLWLAIYALMLAGFVYLAVKTTVLKDMTGIPRDPGHPYDDPKKCGVYSLSLTQLLFWTTLVIGAFIYCLVLTDMTSSLNSSVMLLLGISAGTTGIAYVVDSSFANANPNLPPKTHVNFFSDILTDGSSYSVQRIQVFAWNLVLGIYFIIYTIDNKTMPVFSSTLLFLAGISSATYLGAKAPENTNAKMADTQNKTNNTTTTP